MKVPIAIITVSLVLAATAGFLANNALSQSGPTKTVTIDLKNGETGLPGPAGPRGPEGPAGPAGPKGEKGDPGDFTCPDGFVEGTLVVNHPGGKTTIFTCITPDSN